MMDDTSRAPFVDELDFGFGTGTGVGQIPTTETLSCIIQVQSLFSIEVRAGHAYLEATSDFQIKVGNSVPIKSAFQKTEAKCVSTRSVVHKLLWSGQRYEESRTTFDLAPIQALLARAEKAKAQTEYTLKHLSKWWDVEAQFKVPLETTVTLAKFGAIRSGTLQSTKTARSSFEVKDTFLVYGIQQREGTSSSRVLPVRTGRKLSVKLTGTSETSSLLGGGGVKAYLSRGNNPVLAIQNWSSYRRNLPHGLIRIPNDPTI